MTKRMRRLPRQRSGPFYFEVRYCTELANLDSIHYTLAFRGDAYDIQTVDFMNYQRKIIRIVCKLQKKGGV